MYFNLNFVSVFLVVLVTINQHWFSYLNVPWELVQWLFNRFRSANTFYELISEALTVTLSLRNGHRTQSKASIGSRTGLVPSGDRPLPESMLTRSMSLYGVTRRQWFNILIPNMRQSISWNNDDPVHWHMYICPPPSMEFWIQSHYI